MNNFDFFDSAQHASNGLTGIGAALGLKYTTAATNGVGPGTSSDVIELLAA